jgi:hypothetical protein
MSPRFAVYNPVHGHGSDAVHTRQFVLIGNACAVALSDSANDVVCKARRSLSFSPDRFALLTLGATGPRHKSMLESVRCVLQWRGVTKIIDMVIRFHSILMIDVVSRGTRTYEGPCDESVYLDGSLVPSPRKTHQQVAITVWLGLENATGKCSESSGVTAHSAVAGHGVEAFVVKNVAPFLFFVKIKVMARIVFNHFVLQYRSMWQEPVMCLERITGSVAF